MRTVFILLFSSSTILAQTTYYVNNVSGSDGNSGLSSNSPKKTITNAVVSASTGDIISVTATNQIYTDSTIVSKQLTFASTNGKPQLAYFKVNISNFSSDQVTFMAGFWLQTLVLSAGRIQGSDSITITANGKVVRSSDSAQVLQQLKFAGKVDLEYTGSTNIIMGFEVPASDSTINNLTLNFDSSATAPRLTLIRNLFVYNVNFINGLLVTGPYYIHLDNPVGSQSHGYTKNLRPGRKSHVVGNVRKTLKAGMTMVYGRNEFPIGDFSFYRPMVITLSNYASNQSLGINVVVSETNQRPAGVVGLPIANGVSQGVDIARYANFYWSVQADSTYDKPYTLELTAEGFTDYGDAAYLRIIRRSGTAIDFTNAWVLSGQYTENFIPMPLPTVVSINATGGITKEGNIFTYGMKITDFIYNSPFPPIVYLCPASPTYKRNLKNPPVFTGAQGTFTYSVTISNPSLATANILGDTLVVTRGSQIGASICTVTGTDTYDGRRISTSFTVNTQCSATSVHESDNISPTWFNLSQNYPNPFNPTTTIEFALPQPQFVKLTIYNMLGQEIATLANDYFLPGRYKVKWNPNGYKSGIYFYRLQAGSFVETKKLILLK